MLFFYREKLIIMLPPVKNPTSFCPFTSNHCFCLKTILDLCIICLLIQTSLLFQWRKQICLNDGFVCDWSHVNCLWTTVIFIRCLNSHSDGTHSLQKIFLASKLYNAKFFQICSTNSSTSWMAWEWIKFQHFFFNYSFNAMASYQHEQQPIFHTDSYSPVLSEKDSWHRVDAWRLHHY